MQAEFRRPCTIAKGGDVCEFRFYRKGTAPDTELIVQVSRWDVMKDMAGVMQAFAERIVDGALGGFLPERFPNVVYMRDRPLPPPGARVLAVDADERPALFQVGPNSFGFTGHPGFKTAMAEDLIMEFDESPDDPAPQLQRLQVMVPEIENALVPIMTGLIKMTGWMRPRRRIALELKA